jgi:hypothetical protein
MSSRPVQFVRGAGRLARVFVCPFRVPLLAGDRLDESIDSVLGPRRSTYGRGLWKMHRRAWSRARHSRTSAKAAPCGQVAAVSDRLTPSAEDYQDIASG